MTVGRLGAFVGAMTLSAVVIVSLRSDPPTRGVSPVEVRRDDVPSEGIRAAERDARHLLAGRTVDRLLRLRSGEGPSSLTMSSDEATAVLAQSFPGLLPDGFLNPSVRASSGALVLRADVVTTVWPGADRLWSFLGVLPDTVSAALEGQLTRSDRRLVFDITGARAHGVPVPGRLLDAFIRALPMSVERDQGPSLWLTLPSGIADVRIRGDDFVLFATPRNLDRAVDDG